MTANSMWSLVHITSMALCYGSWINAEESGEQSVPMLPDLAVHQRRNYLKRQIAMEAGEKY